MNGSQIGVLLTSLCAMAAANAQSMFRGDATHSGRYAGPAPRQFHRVKWKFPTGDRVMSSPVFKDNVIYFGGDDGNVYAVDAETGRQIWKRATNGPVPATPAIVDGTLYIGSYDGKFYALDTRTGALKWKVTTEGERRFEAKGLHGLQPKSQTIADQFDVFLSSPVVVNGTVYVGSGDGNLYALDHDRRSTLEIQNRRRCSCVAGARRWHLIFRKLG
jgi:glucose dehydrogenase